jgi:leader peptidase (prepilin peptidase) / N-methyltransferase
VTLPWVIAGAVAGLLAGPPIRAIAFNAITSAGQPPCRGCPDCSSQVLPGGWRWRPVLPITGRCPACQARIGPPLLVAELAAGGALAIVAARASSGWELAALAWLALIAVPLALIDVAVHRLPDRLTAAAFAGTLALLTVAALTAHQPDRLARAAIGAAVLACFYLALCLLRPGQMGLGDAKIAASIGLVLGWTSWQALLTGTFAGFALAAVYGGVQIARNKATRNSQLPLGPFILLGVLAALVLLREGTCSTGSWRAEYRAIAARAAGLGGSCVRRPCRAGRSYAGSGAGAGGVILGRSGVGRGSSPAVSGVHWRVMRAEASGMNGARSVPAVWQACRSADKTAASSVRSPALARSHGRARLA